MPTTNGPTRLFSRLEYTGWTQRNPYLPIPINDAKGNVCSWQVAELETM